MFDFEQFPVYQKAEEFYAKVLKILTNSTIDKSTKDQLQRASTSIILNIAEGAGKYSKKDKKNFYVIARGSTNECVAILRILLIEKQITEEGYKLAYDDLLNIGARNAFCSHTCDDEEMIGDNIILCLLKISTLRNLGPACERWLSEVGIHTKEDLDRVGPITAYSLVKERQPHANLVFLWALVGALLDIPLEEIPKEMKEKLKRELQKQ